MNRRFFCSFSQHFIFFLKERERTDVIESKDVSLTEGKIKGAAAAAPISLT